MALGAGVYAQRPIGVDVSDYQGAINWPSVKSSGVTFAWAKATEGANNYETTFTNNAVSSRAAGVLIGAYHYAHPELHIGTAGAQLEAAHFWNVAGAYVNGLGTCLMPMLDIEEDLSSASPAYTKATLSQWVNAWCSNVVSLAASSGVTVTPVVYTYTSYAIGGSSAEPGLDSTVIIWPLWMASYPPNPNPQTGAPSSTSPWPAGDWQVWQYTGSNTVAGATQGWDGDVCNTSNSLAALVIGGTAAPYFISQPINNRVVDASGMVTFSINAGGTPPINYQWWLNGTNIPSATNASLVIASAQATDAGNYSVIVANNSGSNVSSAVSLTVFPVQTTVFFDDFESNSAANWIVNKSSSDTAVAFNFDYMTLGIPPSPHSVGGIIPHGLQLKANLKLGAVAAVSLSPTNQNFSGDYRLHFDAWINVNGPFPGGGASSTEFLTAGVGTAGNTTEWTGSGSTADGFYFSADGDGGVSATSPTTGDYSGYKGTTWQNAASGIYAAGSLDNANVYYTTAFSNSPAAPALQQSDYSQQTGTLNPGIFGFGWHDVIVSRRGSTVNWTVDGILFATITNVTFAANNVSVGFWDPFASLTDNTNLSFGLVDNVRVEVPAVAPILALQTSPAFSLVGSGQTGVTYILETSTNLTDWATLTNLTATNGAFEYGFVPTGDDARRFFRARAGP